MEPIMRTTKLKKYSSCLSFGRQMKIIIDTLMFTDKNKTNKTVKYNYLNTLLINKDFDFLNFFFYMKLNTIYEVRLFGTILLVNLSYL